MDVICAGILIADVFPSPIDSLPGPGQVRLVDHYLMSAGGCAANTAACLRRLARQVKVIGKVGRDLLGDFVLEDLKRLGVDTSGVVRSPELPTANTYILNVRGEDRRYIHCMGANTEFGLSDIDPAALDGARALYVGGYMLMPAFGVDDLSRIFCEAKRRGLITVLDVVIGRAGSVSLEQVAPALAYTDLFLPNNDEARMLTGRDEPSEQAELLIRANPDCIVAVTLGRNGVLVRHNERVLRAPAFKVESIDESGAGDAFAAGFITGLLESWPLEQTIRFASAVGASCTRKLGCTEGVFGFEEALTFTAQNQLDIVTLGPERGSIALS